MRGAEETNLFIFTFAAVQRTRDSNTIKSDILHGNRRTKLLRDIYPRMFEMHI